MSTEGVVIIVILFFIISEQVVTFIELKQNTDEEM